MEIMCGVFAGNETPWGPGSKLPGEAHKTCVYLDYNATTPIFPEVADEMEPFLRDFFGNPSSPHLFGQPCAEAVRTARLRVAELLDCQPDEIVFTSCGSESDNAAIMGTLSAAREGRLKGKCPHVVTTNIEHPAVLECLAALQKEGRCTFTTVAVDEAGLVTAEQIQKAMTDKTALVTVMHSNNEIGTLLPIAEISKVVKAKGAVMHTDAAQSMGKVPVKVDECGADLVTVVGHKFGAPKGVAALYVRAGTAFGRVQHGGGQERGMRAGTENVLMIAGLGRAAEIAEREAGATALHMRMLRDRLQFLLKERCVALGVETRVNGPKDDRLRLPNTLSISIKGLVANQLLAEVSNTLAASAGSACHAGGDSVSAVLQAIKLPNEFAVGTLRCSVGRHTTPEDIEKAARIIMTAVQNQGLGKSDAA